MNRSRLGPLLRKVRQAKNKQAKEYAEVLGLSTSQMAKLELGQNQPLEGTTLKLLQVLLPHININKELMELEIKTTYPGM